LKVVKSNEGNVYEAARHFNCWGIKKFTPSDVTKNLTVSISEFLPSGGAEMCSSDKERCYVVLRGSITVQDEQGNNHVLDENDMIYIAPGENRAMSVNGTAAARVLVIITK
jgi:quercetin dioxygenase-like cupin family protein